MFEFRLLMRSSFLMALAGVAMLLGASSANAASYAQDARVKAFARDVAEQAGQDFDEVWGSLSQAKRRPDIIRLMRPAKAPSDKNWQAYRSRFITPHRIQRGLRFWQQHAAAVQAAEQRFGIDAHIIIGILGVETIFGQFKGKVRALDALTTLAFDFPEEHPRAEQRAAFFRDELRALFALSHQEGRAVTQWRGSYAGALGFPQFMPSSWRRWAVDFDGDGHINLIDSPVDAIGSVANYLAEHGWQRGLAARWPTTVSGGDPATLQAALTPDIVPTLDRLTLLAAGAQLPPDLPATAPELALVLLHNGRDGAPTYVLGTRNFYAITRYNKSSYYALAVIELGEAIAAERARAVAAAS